MGQEEKKEKYSKAKELGLDVKWTMAESEIDSIINEYEESLKEEDDEDEILEEEIIEEEEDEEIDIEFIDNGDDIVEKPKSTKKKAVKKLEQVKNVSLNNIFPVNQDVVKAKKRESYLSRYFPKKSKLKKNAP